MPRRSDIAIPSVAASPAVQRRGAPMYDLIELMFFAYRDFVRDADRILAGDGFGRAHHRVLYFVARRPGLTIAELLEILEITKQSLNRVLNDLLDRGYVTTRSREADRRCRLLYATARGDALIQEIAEVQSARFERAFGVLGEDAKAGAIAFLTAMLDRADEAVPKARQRLGFATGAFAVPDDFDRMGGAEIARLFGAEE
ncbi:MarR family winged helix-turn-helix transcriptional regulator [Beijerinckia sp. L45]|uniref:MarR family winged helix-turn-helix transcriptional regulator n=1 Tax=Beijerinckia sp. L45 TaxID=1641855 RepID=UPI00131C6D32|nr:MarR family transcriptional regulator [Beijerinckia sp. L45]